MKRLILVLAATALILCAARPASAAGTAVTTCGTLYSGRAFLEADLDCSGYSSYYPAVRLANSASLDLRGFTITASSDPNDSIGVGCEYNCRIFSSEAPGVIRGGTRAGIWEFGDKATTYPSPTVRVDNVIVRDNPGLGIRLWGFGRGGGKLSDVLVTNNGANGVSAGGDANVMIKDSVLTDNGGDGFHMGGTRLKAKRVEISGNGDAGIWASIIGSAALSDVALVGNAGPGWYLHVGSRSGRSNTPSVTIRRSAITDNGEEGMLAEGGVGRLKIDRTSVLRNGGVGVEAMFSGPLTVQRSEISLNALDGLITESGAGPDPVQLRHVVLIDNGGSGAVVYAGPRGLRAGRVEAHGNQTHGLAVLRRTFEPGPCRARISRSSLTGNGLAASCGATETCADVASCDAPDVSGTECETSYDVESGFPGTSWGVCSLD
jgi:hypothetical protein